jgi:O-antigen ligase
MFRLVQRTLLFCIGVSLPIQAYAVDLAGFAATPTKLVTACLLVLALLQFVLTRRSPRRDRKTLPVLIFMTSFGISSVVAFLAGAPLSAVLTVFSTFVGLVLYYFLLAYVVRTRDDLVLLLWAIALGGAITALPAALGLDAGLRAEQRAEGLSGQSNVLGYDLTVCLALAAAVYFGVRSPWRKLLAGAAVAFSGIGILLSLSRSAYVAATAMWGLWMYRSGRIDSLKYALPAVAALLLVLLFSPSAVEDRVGTMLDPGRRAADGSIQSRFVQLEWASRAFLSNPAVGVGTVTFRLWAMKQPGGRQVDHDIHSAYLHVAATQGLAGLVPFILVAVLSWGDYGRAIRAVRARSRLRDPALNELGTYAIFLQIAFCGALVGGFFHPTQNSKTLWLTFALSTVILSLVRERAHALDGSPSAELVRTRRPPAAREAALPIGVTGR